MPTTIDNINEIDTQKPIYLIVEDHPIAKNLIPVQIEAKESTEFQIIIVEDKTKFADTLLALEEKHVQSPELQLKGIILDHNLIDGETSSETMIEALKRKPDFYEPVDIVLNSDDRSQNTVFRDDLDKNNIGNRFKIFETTGNKSQTVTTYLEGNAQSLIASSPSVSQEAPSAPAPVTIARRDAGGSSTFSPSGQQPGSTTASAELAMEQEGRPLSQSALEAAGTVVKKSRGWVGRCCGW